MLVKRNQLIPWSISIEVIVWRLTKHHHEQHHEKGKRKPNTQKSGKRDWRKITLRDLRLTGKQTSRESEKNIFCHYRSDNMNVKVDFDKFGEKLKWRLDRKWFVTSKNKQQIRGQEVKRLQIDMFILYFDQF